MKKRFVLLLSLLIHPAFAGSTGYFPENYESSRARFLNHASSLAEKYNGVETAEITVGAENLAVNLA